ncbi:MAG: hypothetical protein JWP10_1508 [Nocardioidaceae bacterium]|nr:hypothetical protein [Nocardioidaceae bacterium]
MTLERARLTGLLVVIILGLAGCGNAIRATINGRVGIAVDANGNPVVIVAACPEFLDTVTISEGREGLAETEPNKDVGTWNRNDHLAGVYELNLSKPDDSWSRLQPIELKPSTLYIVIAAQSKKDVEATQVSFYGRDVASLVPGRVYTNTGDPDSSELQWSTQKKFTEPCV